MKIKVLLALISLQFFYFGTTFSQNNKKSSMDFSKQWKEIENEINVLGKPKTALLKVKELGKKINPDTNPSDWILYLYYLHNLSFQTQENYEEFFINEMIKEEKKAKGISKPILQSYLADWIVGYIQQNQWKLRQRTSTEKSNTEDVTFLSIAELYTKAFNYSVTSLSNQETKNTSIEKVGSLLQPAQNYLLPTLYDLLSYRALTFLSNESNYVTDPVYRFVLEDRTALSDAQTFMNHHFENKDELSKKYKALTIFQEILKFNSKDKNSAAYQDANLRRLQFVHNTLQHSDNIYLYKNALNQYISQASLPEFKAKAAYLLAGLYYNSGSELTKDEADKNYRKIALQLCEETILKYPKTEGAEDCEALKFNILEPSILLSAERYIVPSKPSLCKVNYKNVEEVFIKVYELDNNLEKLIENRYINYDKHFEIYNQLQKIQPIKAWQEKLIQAGDYTEHSTEIKVPELAVGKYLIFVSNAATMSPKSKNCFTEFQVTNITWVEKRSELNEHYVLHRETGKPLQGVKVKFLTEFWNQTTRKNENKILSETTTNENGFAKMNEKEVNYKVSYSLGNDIVQLSDYFYNSNSNNISVEGEKCILFTDRAIYRPGQTVYFKGLLIQKDKFQNGVNVIPDKQVDVELLDANGQKVFEIKELTTNSFGTFSGSILLPSSGLTGRFTLDSDYGSISFQVEEYKRPTFEVTIKQPEGNFTYNDIIKVNGDVKAFAGYGINDANVVFNVQRKEILPYYPWFYYRAYPRENKTITIKNGAIKTNEKGEFTFEFVADGKGVSSNVEKLLFEISADVTDITGETHSTTQSVFISKQKLFLEINVPQQVRSDETLNIEIESKNVNDIATPAICSVEILKLETPTNSYIQRQWATPDYPILSKADFEKWFPDFAYKNEDQIANWDIESSILKTTLDTKTETKLKNINTNLKTGTYKIIVTTKDEAGNEIKKESYFEYFNTKENQPANTKPLTILSDKKQYQPNDIARIQLYSPGKEIYPVVMISQKEGTKPYYLTLNRFHQIEIPIKEIDRGGFTVQYFVVWKNRIQIEQYNIQVPWTNKQLSITYETFKDKLQPGQETEFRIKVKPLDNGKVAAELLASMYDASLDAFIPHNWSGYSFFQDYRDTWNFTSTGFSIANSTLLEYNREYPNKKIYTQYPSLKSLYNQYGYGGGLVKAQRTMAAKRISGSDDGLLSEVQIASAPQAEAMMDAEGNKKVETTTPKSKESPASPRTNLKETVFFQPQLRTDAEGNIILAFKMNEALTKWKLMTFAHTQDLKYAYNEQMVVTQKEVMIQPTMPRFLREGDKIKITGKVVNLTSQELKGVARLRFRDLLTDQNQNSTLQLLQSEIPFTVAAGVAAPLSWEIQVPEQTLGTLVYTMEAKTDNFSDGEEGALPVLTNRMLVTESIPLTVRAGQSKTFTLDKIKNHGSSTLQHHQLKLDITPNPVWYAVQALPYMMEYPHECSEQLWNRIFAHSLASHIVKSKPKIEAIFKKWQDTPDALSSNLSKNQELKAALLEETPWVVYAQNEEQQKKNIALLFDVFKMSSEIQNAVKKLSERQMSNGGFPWFHGDRDNPYISQNILEGIAHLKQLGVELPQLSQLTNQLLVYVDARFTERYEALKKLAAQKKINLKDDHLDAMSIHYLYTRSFFDKKMDAKVKEGVNYYLGQSEKYWKKGLQLEALLAISTHRYDKKAVAQTIMTSLKERAIITEEMGAYYKNDWGYYWYSLPIETQSIILEAFHEINHDEAMIDGLKTWLLQQKRTHYWTSTKSTAAAVYALLLRGQDWMEDSKFPYVKLGDKVIGEKEVKQEEGTGRFQFVVEGKNIQNNMSSVTIENKNQVPLFGGMYWQYFENMDKVTLPGESLFKLNKTYFKEVKTDRGAILEKINSGAALKSGDKIIVRIELTVNRQLEFVHLKDYRPSNTEPTNVLSTYKWQNGLGYYESTKDMATHFFLSYLPKGTHVFEYPIRVIHEGDCTAGIAQIQCMYAPEFSAHSNGQRMKVGK